MRVELVIGLAPHRLGPDFLGDGLAGGPLRPGQQQVDQQQLGPLAPPLPLVHLVLAARQLEAAEHRNAQDARRPAQEAGQHGLRGVAHRRVAIRTKGFEEGNVFRAGLAAQEFDQAAAGYRGPGIV